MHLRLYYTDMLAAKPVPNPVPPPQDTWEVEEMKKFVFQAKPRTRLDAYPLLLVTQDVFRRVAEKEIKIVSKHEQEMALLLGEMTANRDRLQLDLELTQKDLADANVQTKFNKAAFLLKPTGNNPEQLAAYEAAQVELAKYKSEHAEMSGQHEALLAEIAALKQDVLNHQVGKSKK